MPVTKYTKWIPSPLDGLSVDELLNELADFFLQSGFEYGYPRSGDPHQIDALKQAIIERLVEMGRLPEATYRQWLDDRTSEASQELDQLIDQLIRRMIDEG
jgi:hypothetical protein